jgi:hypothetical protein
MELSEDYERVTRWPKGYSEIDSQHGKWFHFSSQHSYYLWIPRDLLFIGYRGFFIRDKKTVK